MSSLTLSTGSRSALMNQALRTLSVMLVIGLAPHAKASDDWRDIQTGDSSLLYSDAHVDVRGSWKPAGDYKFPRISGLNASYIHCDHAAMTCVESQANVEQLRGRDAHSSPYLNVYTIEYKIEQWSKTSIVARRVSPRGLPVDSVLSIDPTTGRVRMEWKDRPAGDRYFLPAEQQFDMLVRNHHGT